MGQYTSGFNQSKVVDCLKGRLGWKQPTMSGSPTLNDVNTGSVSKRYFNDGSFHPLVTIDNLKATIEDANVTDDLFNIILADLQEAVIQSAVTAVFNKSESIEQVTLFERSLNNDQLITGSSKFVGIRFKLGGSDTALQVRSIAIYFNAAKDFQLYLYHDVKKDPLWQQQVSSTADDQKIEIPIDELILNTNGLYKGGYYYLGYYQDELENDCKAYYENYCRNKTFAFDFDFFQSSVLGDDFDRRNVALSSINFGLNAEVSTFHDHTDKIIRSASLFDNVIGLQMAYTLCKQMLFAVRSNKNQRILKEAFDQVGLQYELDGKVPITDVPKSTGLVDKINAEIERLRQSFSPSPKSQVVNYAEC
jgi:hypothetical protein